MLPFGPWAFASAQMSIEDDGAGSGLHWPSAQRPRVPVSAGVGSSVLGKLPCLLSALGSCSWSRDPPPRSWEQAPAGRGKGCESLSTKLPRQGRGLLRKGRGAWLQAGPGGQRRASGPPILGARLKCRRPALDRCLVPGPLLPMRWWRGGGPVRREQGWVGCPGQSGWGLIIALPGLLQPCHLQSHLVLPGTSPYTVRAGGDLTDHPQRSLSWGGQLLSGSTPAPGHRAWCQACTPSSPPKVCTSCPLSLGLHGMPWGGHCALPC